MIKITSHIHIHSTRPPFNISTKTITHVKQSLTGKNSKPVSLVLQIHLCMSKQGIHSENLQLQKPENDLQKLLNHYKIV